MQTRAIAFIATARPAESRSFYAELLGLRLMEESDFALVFDAYGTMLRVQKAAKVVVAPYTAFGLEVADLDPVVEQLLKRGVEPRRYPHFAQDERGVWQASDGTRVFWFEDPDGNLLSLSQFPGSQATGR